jgi:hypothetical protein
MDYAALAKQYGGTTAAPAVDYAALAKQYGGTTADTQQFTVQTPQGKNVDVDVRFPTAAPAQPTMVEKAYKAVRPFAAPLVEAGGAIVGGLAGTPLGPLGTVGGAGLGYGIAKEALELGDIYLGGKAPRQGAAQVVEPVRNVIEGSTMEMGGQALAKGLGYVGGKVADFRQVPTQKAAALAQKALGDDLPTVLNMLRNAPPNASVAELTAKIENPTWQALIKNALEKDPQFVRKAQLLGERESRNALAKLAGGTTATDVRAAGETAKNMLNTVTGPMRETALTRANLGKAVAEYEAQAGKLSAEAAAKVQEVRRLIELGDNAAAAARLETIKAGLPASSAMAPAKSQAGFSDKWAATYTYPGKLAQMSDEWASQAANASLDLGQGAQFAQSAANSLRSVGIKPLEGGKLAESISTLANKPEFAGNDVLAGAVKNVANDIAKWTNQGGVIDAKALEAIRKNSVNAAIAQLRPGVDATAQRNLAAGVMSKMKPLIDDAIEGAGGAGWRDYLTKHSEGMRKIAETKLSGEALRLWKSDKDAFVRLVQNESPEVVEKFLGPGNYNIATELADSTMAVLQKQAEKRLTELSVKEQVTEGGAALAQLLKQETSRFRFPSFLNFWASAGNKTLSELEQRLGNKTMEQLTKAMKTPEGAADLLKTLPAAERNQVLQILSDPSTLSKGSSMYPSSGKFTLGQEAVKAGKAAQAIRTGASVNMLTPEQEIQNALAK